MSSNNAIWISSSGLSSTVTGNLTGGTYTSNTTTTWYGNYPGICNKCGNQWCTCGTYIWPSSQNICPFCSKYQALCTCNRQIAPSLNCANCGQAFGSCSCITVNPGTNIWPGGGTSTFTILPTMMTPEIVLAFQILDGVTKAKYLASGWLKVLEKHAQAGVYLNINSISLPAKFSEYFYCFKKASPLWQVRSPLLLKVAYKGQDDKEEQTRFCTVTAIGTLSEEDKQVHIGDVYLHEVADNLELMRLVEINRAYRKLLKKI